MADMLKFRRGTHAQINSATLSNGTIYIATDEKAMYVDTATERIRISDIVKVATFNELQPPFSNDVFYYVENDNALLKRVAITTTNKETGEPSIEYKWKQINGTKELSDALSAVTNRVSALEGAVGSATSGLVKDVADLKTAVGDSDSGLVKDVADNAADIENLKKAVGMGEDGDAEGIGATVVKLGEDLDQAEKDIDALEGVVAGHTSALGTLQGGADVAGSVAEAKKAAEDAAALAGQKTTMAAVEAKDYATKAQAQGYADAKDAAIKAAADAAAAAQATASAAVTKSAFESFKTENTAAISTAAADAVEDANEYTDGKIAAEVTRADGKYATQTALKATSDTVAGHTQAINGINTTLESVVTKNELAGKNYATTGDVATAKTEAIQAAATAAAGIYATKTELGATNDLVSAAQGKADDAYELAAGKTTTAAVKEQIEAYGYATTGQVATAKQEAVAAAKTAGDAAYAAKSIENTVSSHAASLTTLTGANTVAGSVAQAKKAGDDAQKTIDDYVTAHSSDYSNTEIDNKIADAKKAGTDAGTQAEANKQAIAGIKATVDTLDGTVDTEGSVKNQIKVAVDAAKTALSAEIDADIRAANAMEYAGTVSSASQLPATAKNGATYVVSATFGTYAPGDMLIAQGTEDADTGLITNPTWAHVKSGYDASLDQKLIGKENKIMLSNGINNDEDASGSIAFEATGSASVTVSGNTVTVGMIWEDFDTEEN